MGSMVLLLAGNSRARRPLTRETSQAMGHYKSNLRDLEFNLFEVFGADQSLGTGPFVNLDKDSARDLLKEVERLASHDLAASFVDGDRTPPVFDKETGNVSLPASFLKSYQTYHDGGWDRECRLHRGWWSGGQRHIERSEPGCF